MKLGLIGAGIQRSRSPALHEHEAAAQGLRLTYELIDLDPLGIRLRCCELPIRIRKVKGRTIPSPGPSSPPAGISRRALEGGSCSKSLRFLQALRADGSR